MKENANHCAAAHSKEGPFPQTFAQLRIPKRELKKARTKGTNAQLRNQMEDLACRDGKNMDQSLCGTLLASAPAHCGGGPRCASRRLSRADSAATAFGLAVGASGATAPGLAAGGAAPGFAALVAVLDAALDAALVAGSRDAGSGRGSGMTGGGFGAGLVDRRSWEKPREASANRLKLGLGIAGGRPSGGGRMLLLPLPGTVLPATGGGARSPDARGGGQDLTLGLGGWRGAGDLVPSGSDSTNIGASALPGLPGASTSVTCGRGGELRSAEEAR